MTKKTKEKEREKIRKIFGDSLFCFFGFFQLSAIFNKELAKDLKSKKIENSGCVAITFDFGEGRHFGEQTIVGVEFMFDSKLK